MTTYAFAAAGTGGHVYPALSVADELLARGVARNDIVFFGGKRLAATAVPSAGYEYVEVPLRGLQRSSTVKNVGIPFVVMRAVRIIRRELRARNVKVMLATGGYVTVPAGWAAKRSGVTLFLQEQNAKPGLANKAAAPWAQRAFLSVPAARSDLPGEVTGTPLRAEFDKFDREALRPEAFRHYGVSEVGKVVGVLGGSLGARVLNDAVPVLLSALEGAARVIHITGREHVDQVQRLARGREHEWRVVPFEDQMHLFYAACDLVVCRGGATTVSELTVTGTPSVMVPRHATDQEANAAALASTGATRVVVDEAQRIAEAVTELIRDSLDLQAMAEAAKLQGRPGAAARIATVMMEAAA